MVDDVSILSEDQVRAWIDSQLPVGDFAGKRLLLIVPDSTRTAPLPLLFDAVHTKLAPHVARVDVLVALGTHPPMPQTQIRRMLGIDEETQRRRFTDVGLFNHEWDQPDKLITIGQLSKTETSRFPEGPTSWPGGK